MKRWLTTSLLIAMAALPAATASARVKLITLPVRERVEVQLDHDHATLVEEERIVPLIAGVNQVDFSWKNTRIDPGTIVFRVLGAADEGGEQQINVLSVTYPPGEQALVWQVAAKRSGSARVRISYLLGGLEKSFHYRAIAANDEKTLTLAQYIRVRNFAGESYDDTQILAGYGDTFSKPIGINETKEMLVAKTPGIPVLKTYTANAHQHGYLNRAKNKLNVPMHYVIHNDKEHQLGGAPLPYGKARIFQKDSQGTAAFLGEDWGDFTPIDDAMELYLGLAQDVAVVRKISDRKRHRVAGNLYHGEVFIEYEIENFKNKPVVLNLVEEIEALRHEAGFASGQPASWTIGPETTFKGKPNAEKSNADRVQFSAELPARNGDQAEKVTHILHLRLANQW